MQLEEQTLWSKQKEKQKQKQKTKGKTKTKSFLYSDWSDSEVIWLEIFDDWYLSGSNPTFRLAKKDCRTLFETKQK